MAITIKYIGTADNYAELPVTGKQSVWQLGQQEERGDVEAGLLLATGLFSSLPLPVMSTINPLTGEIDFSGKLAGNLASDKWFNPPSIFRLLLNGTGIVTIDSKDAAGTIKTGVYSTTLSSAVNEIAFPYAGDSAIQIRATLTGTATAKVI